MSPQNDKDTLTFTSSRFGELSAPITSVVEFRSGIIGFPKLRQYVLLDYDEPFSWLQSVEDPDLAFVVVSGAEFGENYTQAIPFPKGDENLDLKDDDEIAIVNVVSVRSDPAETTVNLKAPLIVNLRNRYAIQLVMDNPELSTRHPLWAESPQTDKNKKK